MRNGQVKHSSKLCEADLGGNIAFAHYYKIEPPTLQLYQNKPGFYVGISTPLKGTCITLKGPFNTPEQAIEAHREWMWELKNA